jgi:hypothetical protein
MLNKIALLLASILRIWGNWAFLRRRRRRRVLWNSWRKSAKVVDFEAYIMRATEKDCYFFLWNVEYVYLSVTTTNLYVYSAVEFWHENMSRWAGRTVRHCCSQKTRILPAFMVGLYKPLVWRSSSGFCYVLLLFPYLIDFLLENHLQYFNPSLC